MQIRFLPGADTDLAEARVWYGLQRDGLDVKLMRRIDETLQRISDAPRRFPLIPSPPQTGDCQAVSICDFLRSD